MSTIQDSIDSDPLNFSVAVSTGTGLTFSGQTRVRIAGTDVQVTIEGDPRTQLSIAGVVNINTTLVEVPSFAERLGLSNVHVDYLFLSIIAPGFSQPGSGTVEAMVILQGDGFSGVMAISDNICMVGEIDKALPSDVESILGLTLDTGDGANVLKVTFCPSGRQALNHLVESCNVNTHGMNPGLIRALGELNSNTSSNQSLLSVSNVQTSKNETTNGTENQSIGQRMLNKFFGIIERAPKAEDFVMSFFSIRASPTAKDGTSGAVAMKAFGYEVFRVNMDVNLAFKTSCLLAFFFASQSGKTCAYDLEMVAGGKYHPPTCNMCGSSRPQHDMDNSRISSYGILVNVLGLFCTLRTRMML